MKLNHIDLPVTDIAAVRLFLETRFELRCIFTREDGLTVLLDENRLGLTLSPLPQGEGLKYPTGFHVGSNLDGEDELLELHGGIRSAGVPIVRPLSVAGALTFHCQAPGPILVEVAWRPPA
jgi:lactoylglutathione lyase